jgi:glucose-1-phosphate thymidylyltransferase
MIGVILAGGLGTRLFPLTKNYSKHLLPVYDKPLIYYPLATLMLAKINEIIIVSDKPSSLMYNSLLGNGSNLGLKLKYAIQERPRGIADGLKIATDLSKKKDLCLILGDNIFYAEGLAKFLINIKDRMLKSSKNFIFAYRLNNSNINDYGVIKYDKLGRAKSLIEKPKKFISNYIIPGLYFYNRNSLRFLDELKFSKRAELEISDFNNLLLKKNKLEVIKLGRGTAWFDAGKTEKLFEASVFIKTLQERNGFRLGCIEEIAFNNNFISNKQFDKLIKISKGEYRKYLENCLYNK